MGRWLARRLCGARDGQGPRLGVAPVPALMMGVITGCVGGTIRDILAGVPSIIMRARNLCHRGGVASRAVCPPPGSASRRSPLSRAASGFVLGAAQHAGLGASDVQ